MKKLLCCTVLLTSFLCCTKTDTGLDIDVSDSSTSGSCTYNGHTLYKGSQGGCYYYSGNSKEYVDRSYCNCN